jgi:hypothetical protein
MKTLTFALGKRVDPKKVPAGGNFFVGQRFPFHLAQSPPGSAWSL